jgi:hypothetical protein
MMRTLRSQLVALALGVAVCQSATLLAAPLVLCAAARAETASSGVHADCPCGDETGMCPMHHKTARSDRPAPTAPAKGKAYCSGCSDSSDAALLVMTSFASPIVAPFDLVVPRVEGAVVTAACTLFVPVVHPPSAPPPKA